MKAPPLLLGATLVFWGWQTGFLHAGILMAVLLESARFVTLRWEFSDDDFSRIWTFCTVLFLATAIYAFTDNGGPSQFGSLFENPSGAAQNAAGNASARTAAAMLRWLPMVLFLFIAAQTYSTRDEIPLTTISLILRRRWKKAAREGKPLPVHRGINVSYPYFAVCLFSASVHPGEGDTYFWGLCALLAWALWMHRSPRYGALSWTGTLCAAVAFGYFAENGVGRLQNYLQNLNANWFVPIMSRGTDPSQSRTALGQIGLMKLSGRILVRLQTEGGIPAPAYLREASYRYYKTPVWSADTPKEDFQNISESPSFSGNWILVPRKAVPFKARIACYLTDRSRETDEPIGLLPLPTGVGRLEHLPAYVVQKNSFGAVMAEGPGLVVFDALYGPGPTPDSPPDMKEDLSVFEKEKPALDEVISRLQLTNHSFSAVLRTVNTYFDRNFEYSLWQGPPHLTATNETPLSRFLLRTHKGHCEYFATATVLLLRELGIPARYAVGYAVHEKSGGGYVVRERDAHAWCLAWNEERQQWENFDTTPVSWIETEAGNASPFEALSDGWSWIRFQLAKFRWGQSNLRQYLLLGLAPVFLILLYQIFFRRKHRRQNQRAVAELTRTWPGLDLEFYRVENRLAARGLLRHPNEPVYGWLQRALADPALAPVHGPLCEITRLHYRYRFDPQGLREADREELRRGAEAVLAALR